MMNSAISRMLPLTLFLAAVHPAASVAAVQATPASHAPGDAPADRLTRIGTVHAVALAQAMRREDWKARRVEASGPFRAPGAEEALTAALVDERPVVRRLALWGLSELRASGARHVSARLLDDHVPEVRAEATRALGDMNAAEYAGRIAALLDDPSSFVRVQAAHALGDLQDPGTRSALEAAVHDRDGAVRARAAWALRRIAEAERIRGRRPSR